MNPTNIKNTIELLDDKSLREGWHTFFLDIFYSDDFIKIEEELDNIRTFQIFLETEEKAFFDKIIKAIVHNFRYGQGGYTTLCPKRIVIHLSSSNFDIIGKKDKYNAVWIWAFIPSPEEFRGVYAKAIVGYETVNTEWFERYYVFFPTEDEFIKVINQVITNKDVYTLGTYGEYEDMY